jgi:hypothetical protein
MPTPQRTATTCAPPRAKDPCAKREAPACPDCGGLKCLCRPRFFAGQLLTEQDLNRLDRYIRDKNRLHNRHLFGWGVVCGLEVSCDPCDEGNVRVSPGYALGPCGDDIVVCEQDTVDICELIKCCRQQTPRDCRPYGRRRDCEGAEEQWVLAISYQESPSRGITALKGGSCSKCGASPCICADGNDSGCGCGTQGSTALRPRAAPAACEPTIVCEGYRYEVFRLPTQDPQSDDSRGGRRVGGDLVDRVMCCIQPLFDLLRDGAAALAEAQSQQARFQVCCRIKRDLRDLIAGLAIRHCGIFEQLEAIVCPDPGLPDDLFSQRMDQVGDQVLLILWEVAMECLCKALLPPCPDPSQDPRVPLALVTVSGGQCRVRDVCNWTRLRKFVTTFPNLQYWLSWLPYGRMLRQLIEQICCGLLELRRDLQTDSTPSTNAAGLAQPAVAAQPEVRAASTADRIVQPRPAARDRAASAAFSEVALDALRRDSEGVTLGRVLSGLSGAKDGAGLSEAERDNPVPFLMLNLLAKPLLRDGLPGAVTLTETRGGPDAAAMLAAFMGGPVGRAGGANVEAELGALREQLGRQEQAIKALQAELAKR